MINLKRNKLFFYNKKDLITVSIYGEPIITKEECNKVKSLQDAINFRDNTPGYFAIIIELGNKTYVINDIFANYRLYYSVSAKFVSDSFKLSQPKNLNKDEIQYFYKKGYTTAFGTIQEDVKKVPPLGYLEVVDGSIQLHYAHLVVNERYATSKYEANIRDRIISTLSKIDKDERLFLFLSGGIDSIYLSEIMIAMKREFTVVFVRYSVSDQDNTEDLEKTVKYCLRRELPLEVIEFGSKEDISKYKEITQAMQPLDHSFYSFYKATEEIEKKYGKVTIINGQSSDSIFCWGISGENISSKLQRFIYSDLFLNLNFVLRKIIFTVYTFVYRYRYKLPKINKIPADFEKLNCAWNMPVGYVPLIDNKSPVIKYLAHIVKNQWVDDVKMRLVIAKLNYLQGSSNQMPISSADYAGHKLVMPFLDPFLVLLIYSNQNTFKRILNPRYELKHYLDDILIMDMKTVKRNKIRNDVDKIMSLHRRTWIEKS